jgi:hypothetical protein
MKVEVCIGKSKAIDPGRGVLKVSCAMPAWCIGSQAHIDLHI